MQRRFVDDALAEHQHGGQAQDDDRRADQRAARQQRADAADNGNIAAHVHPEGGEEEHRRALENRTVGFIRRDPDRLILIPAALQLLLEARAHEHRVIHRSAELHAADHGGRDERDLGPRQKRDRFVDHDGKLDRQHQQHGHGDRFEADEDQQKDRGDGNDIRDREIAVRDLDQVFGKDPLARQDRAGTIALYDRGDLFDLGVERVAGGFVFGVHHHELPAALYADAAHVIRQHGERDRAAHDRVKRKAKRYAVHGLDLLRHGGNVRRGRVLRQQDEMRTGHIEFVLQLSQRHDGRDILRQRVYHIVIDLYAFLPEEGRYEQQNEHDRGDGLVFENERVEPAEPRHKALVRGLLDQSVEAKHKGRQHGEHRYEPQQHALGHHDPDVEPQRELHEAQREEPGDRSQRAAGDGNEGRLNGGGHCVRLIREFLLFLLVAVNQEHGEIHGHSELQDGGDTLRDIGDLSHDEIGTHIVQYRVTEGHQRNERQREGAHGKAQGDQRQGDRDRDKERRLRVRQLLGIERDGGKAAHKAVFVHDSADLPQRLHGARGGAGFHELHHHHGAFAVRRIEHGGKDLRQHGLGDAHVRDIVHPHHLPHAVHLADLGFHTGNVPQLVILRNDHRHRGVVERLVQDPFSPHGFQILGEIGQDIVVYVRRQVTDDRRKQQKRCDQKDRFGMTGYKLRDFSDHASVGSFENMCRITEKSCGLSASTE